MATRDLSKGYYNLNPLLSSEMKPHSHERTPDAALGLRGSDGCESCGERRSRVVALSLPALVSVLHTGEVAVEFDERLRRERQSPAARL